MPQILMPYTVRLDHTLRVTPLNTLFASGDSAAHRFELTIMRAGVQDDLNGCTVMCKFYRMADSTVVSVPGSVEDEKAVAVLDAACYDYIGRFVLTIAIKKGDEETTVFYGDGYMHGQRADTAISGEYIIYDINTLIEKIAEIDAATQAANTAASNANTATGKANTAASTANTAATNANTAKDSANAAAGKINNMTVSATTVSTGTATAALSTVDGHYHLALGLPKGNTGATPQISVQVQTGAAGSEASVSVSGTAEEPVIHLTIPRGDVGDIGNLTINGKAPDGSGAVTLTAADVGALPTGGTAADSSKLGGKAPEYYLQPRNLLDNSNFEIAQAGYNGNHGTTKYACDRWVCTAGTVVTKTASGLLFPAGGVILQKLKGLAGKTFTFAAKGTGGANKRISFSNTGYEGVADKWFSEEIGVCTYTMPSNEDEAWMYISNESGDNVTFEWAALYEGEYTAETLPPYVPKGYAAELAECRRYFERLGAGFSERICNSVYVVSGAKSFVLSLQCSSKRIQQPSVSISSVGNYRILLKDGTNASTYSSCSISSIDDITIQEPFISFRVNIVSAITQNSWILLQRSDDATEAYIDISADL